MTYDDLDKYAHEVKAALELYAATYYAEIGQSHPLARCAKLGVAGEGSGAPSLHMDTPDGVLMIIVTD